MAVLKFDLSKLDLAPCEDGNSFILTPDYSDFSIFLDTSVVKFLTDCKILIELNNMFLIIETENNKHWRISPIDGKSWSCVGGKIITKEEEKIKILCTELDTEFKLSEYLGI
jgi:hypothetical protein